MRQVLHRLLEFVREIASGIDAGHAIRHGAPAPDRARYEDDGAGGGPFLHWVPDRDGGLRLAGEFVPAERPPGVQAVQRRRPDGRGADRPGPP